MSLCSHDFDEKFNRFINHFDFSNPLKNKTFGLRPSTEGMPKAKPCDWHVCIEINKCEFNEVVTGNAI